MLDKDYSHATEALLALFIARLQKIWLHLPVMFSWSSLKRRQDQLIKITKDIMNKVTKDLLME